MDNAYLRTLPTKTAKTVINRVLQVLRITFEIPAYANIEFIREARRNERYPIGLMIESLSKVLDEQFDIKTSLACWQSKLRSYLPEDCDKASLSSASLSPISPKRQKT